jgi:hypothetical protein
MLIDTTTPYVRLQNLMQDEMYRTPPKLDFWKVYYEPVGELSINVDRYYEFHTDTIAQGDSVRITLGVQNISYTPMDSVLVHFEIRNSANEIMVSEYQRIAPVGIKESIFTNFVHHTRAMPQDNYMLRVEFNPVNPKIGVYDQLETLHFNNILYRPFYVYSDRTKPSLDVTFDNRHLLNGDYVSSEPQIMIRLFDENAFLLLQDTSVLTIAIRNLTTNSIEPYYFSGNFLTFTPATAWYNSCAVLFTPKLNDGTYELIVTAHDEAGNAHENPYTIQFKVAAKSQISTLFNFPNPAQNYTTFRIVLSGNTLPYDAKITIYSPQGALVHEIQLRNLHIGTNDIPFYWNTDMKNLVPGVYTYQLTYSNPQDFGVLPNTSGVIIKSGNQKLIIQK